MRILHIVHQYLPDHIGGTELYTRSLALAQARHDHQVAIFTQRNGVGTGVERRMETGVEVYRAWASPSGATRRFLATFGELRLEAAFLKVLDRHVPDLAHVQHLMGLPAALVTILQKRGIPLVITLHDYWWICANAQLITNYNEELCGGPRLWFNCARCALAHAGVRRGGPLTPALVPLLAFREQKLRRILNGAACLVAPSDFVKEWYVAHGVAQERIQVVPHGVERPPQPLTARRPGANTADRVHWRLKRTKRRARAHRGSKAGDRSL